MDEYINGVPQNPLQAQAGNNRPQINEQTLTPAWQPHTHSQQHATATNKQQDSRNDDRPVYDFSLLNLQKPTLPHGPSVHLSHGQVDHMKKEVAHQIAQERRQLDEAEQILAMPGFLKAFDLFLKASRK